MSHKLTNILIGALFLLSASVSAIEPKTEIAKETKRLLSTPNCHESVLKAIKRSKYIEEINKRYYPNDDNQQAIYEISLLLVESGNPANALRTADRLTDFERKYEVAEALIRSGNPRNGVECLESMPKEYIIKGINLLEQTGNSGNAKILKNFLKDSKRY